MVSVEVPVVAPLLSAIELELREQVMNTEVGGVQASVTVPLKPFRASTVMVDEPVPPGAEMFDTVPNIE
jgi:hypothetical protein